MGKKYTLFIHSDKTLIEVLKITLTEIQARRLRIALYEADLKPPVRSDGKGIVVLEGWRHEGLVRGVHKTTVMENGFGVPLEDWEKRHVPGLVARAKNPEWILLLRRTTEGTRK